MSNNLVPLSELQRFLAGDDGRLRPDVEPNKRHYSQGDYGKYVWLIRGLRIDLFMPSLWVEQERLWLKLPLGIV